MTKLKAVGSGFTPESPAHIQITSSSRSTGMVLALIRTMANLVPQFEPAQKALRAIEPDALRGKIKIVDDEVARITFTSDELENVFLCTANYINAETRFLEQHDVAFGEIKAERAELNELVAIFNDWDHQADLQGFKPKT